MSKVILVTGGSSGIGKAIALHLHAKGFKVYGTSRSPEKYVTSVPFSIIALDVVDEASIQQAVQQIIEKEGKIDVLVNNAGIGIMSAVEDATIDEVQEIFDTNVYGVIRTTRSVLPSMRKQGAGLIINVSSIAGYMGLPYRGIYSASKSAVHRITEALRHELKPYGVYATCVDPGDFATNINDNRRVSKASREGSVYKNEIDRVEAMVHHEVKYSSNPAMIGELIEKIIATPRPNVSYQVGKPLQKLSLFVKRIVSEQVFERIIANHYKMPKLK
ncbi:MAG: SDR family oxidoreductase [Cytophagaceae bacterium]|jgi:NAD(P)-dependent dehydrogenase (short-subunit alcohol dehydrogenase family)|nr:SDR family oxidoreductase [Cytophagaceae bacterium]